MGYYTYHDLTVTDKNGMTPDDSVLIDMANYLTSISKWFEPTKKGKTIIEIVGHDEMKWYDCNEDMLKVSEAFPSYHLFFGVKVKNGTTSGRLIILTVQCKWNKQKLHLEIVDYGSNR